MSKLSSYPVNLAGTYGLMKKPSLLIWEEEEPDTCRLPERRTPHKWKKIFRVPGKKTLVAAEYNQMHCISLEMSR